MATLITKNSSTASSIPTAGQLTAGELAVNTADKRVFTKNAAGVVIEVGTTPTSLTTATLVATTADINGGTIDGATVGATTAAAGSFTTVNASGASTLTGAVGVGVTPAKKLHVRQATDSDGIRLDFPPRTGFWDIELSGLTSDSLVFKQNNGSTFFTPILFNRSTGLAVTGAISATEIISANKGITFPATQVASANANTLDDYEEGTWTPVVFGRTSAGTGTYTRQVGTYTKIGNSVRVFCNIVWTAHTGTGDLAISGMPFTTDATLGHNTSFAITVGELTFSGQIGANVDKASTTFGLNQIVSNTAIAGVAMDGSGVINASGFYKTS